MTKKQIIDLITQWGYIIINYEYSYSVQEYIYVARVPTKYLTRRSRRTLGSIKVKTDKSKLFLLTMLRNYLEKEYEIKVIEEYDPHTPLAHYKYEYLFNAYKYHWQNNHLKPEHSYVFDKWNNLVGQGFINEDEHYRDENGNLCSSFVIEPFINPEKIYEVELDDVEFILMNLTDKNMPKSYYRIK